jgi:hypothetical protein
MYISPNFEIEKDKDSSIITPKLNENNMTIDSFVFVNKLGIKAVPEINSEEINRDRIVLSKIGKLQTMYLYSNGKIKIER